MLLLLVLLLLLRGQALLLVVVQCWLVIAELRLGQRARGRQAGQARPLVEINWQRLWLRLRLLLVLVLHTAS